MEGFPIDLWLEAIKAADAPLLVAALVIANAVRRDLRHLHRRLAKVEKRLGIDDDDDHPTPPGSPALI